jgi:hypothetical protein
MGRLNPQRRAALREQRAKQYAVRLVLDLKERVCVKSGPARSSFTNTKPVGNPRPNARSWEMSRVVPKGSVRARGHLDKGLSADVKHDGTRFVPKTKGRLKLFSRE